MHERALYHWTCLYVKHGEGTHIEGQPYEAQGGPVDVNQLLVQGLHAVVLDSHLALCAQEREAVLVTCNSFI